ncbi:hypothetical protein FOA52_008150 [Chlamydomonas sp. UWO 241]|nr:hypothetical protein FOA52_008150 [Chlamydomonas sp. UWO 241]
MLASENGHVNAMRLLLDHPSADLAAMMAFDNVHGNSALTAAAGFAAGRYTSTPAPTRSCTPLLLLLRRITVQPQPSDAQQAHMTKVMEVLCRGQRSTEMFDEDQPDDIRDMCICLLLEQGARGFDSNSPVMSRIIRESFALARLPQLINEAVLGIAAAQQQPKPRGDA